MIFQNSSALSGDFCSIWGGGAAEASTAALSSLIVY